MKYKILGTAIVLALLVVIYILMNAEPQDGDNPPDSQQDSQQQ